MDGTFNALGNSDRATAVIGHAVRLVLINLFDVRPGGIDRSTLGHPNKFSFCAAEDEEGSPWETLGAALIVGSGLVVAFCESARHKRYASSQRSGVAAKRISVPPGDDHESA